MKDQLLPSEFTQRWLSESENLTIFGVRISDLSRDELIAALVFSFRQEKQARDDIKERTRFMFELMKK